MITQAEDPYNPALQTLVAELVRTKNHVRLKELKEHAINHGYKFTEDNRLTT